MILFCEECGTRHIIDETRIIEASYRFTCDVCQETLMVARSRKPGGKTAQALLGQPPPATGEAPEKALDILVVDDSKIIRKVLREIIESDARKRVVGEAEHGKQALELLNTLHPDVITLDINMPVMDGLTTLKHIMICHPVPTVMISALTHEGATETFDSLKYGAIDFLPKPSRTKGGDLQTQKNEILRKIELAAQVQLESIRYLRRPSRDKAEQGSNGLPCRHLVVMGVAEGGYGALLNVIPRISARLPAAYVAVMHQAAHHVDGFARYLHQCSKIAVKRITDGVRIQAGTCYLAAASEQVSFVGNGDRIELNVQETASPEPQSGIDRVMSSAAACMGANLAGIVLTGAGEDGVAGLGVVIENGGTAIVQDPRSCLYKETPMRAMERYGIENLVSDKQMAGALSAFLADHTN